MWRKYNVLFLCRENSARSMMAEALLRELAGERFNAFSAGDRPATRLHPLTIAQLRPGISTLATLIPKNWMEFIGERAPTMDLIVALDERLDEYHAPSFPGAPSFCTWHFADPLAEGMTQRERERSFEQVFRQMVRRIGLFVELPRYLTAARAIAPTIDTLHPGETAAMASTGLDAVAPCSC
ncbi:protein-tyrosine-phosphatase [Paraburkholderia sp. RAU2J]|uniref:arsenate reductase/protein-tyrosine-phosphatase family protein n=1 Tax=Paraburkholderia sp. RAU2J TaxID=1938810 RepID=UPI000EB29FD9|nr:low molecular weight phosphatase family protein [Paraburkholderia sp. RAU2J]RKT26405.1 protein-tyrosine-phosphatase [Paraburkholderia sp. RAU2J]